MELGEAEVDDAVIDDGLGIIRKLWDAGLAHRDIKPANLLVRDGRLLLIDVAFVETRPTPVAAGGRPGQHDAVPGAALQPRAGLPAGAAASSRVEEISEGFAAARGLALPSQLRHDAARPGPRPARRVPAAAADPAPPIRVQRWSARRIGLLRARPPAFLVVLGKVSNFVLVNNDVTTTPLEIASLDCDQPEPLWLQAQSVPSASLVPCLHPLRPDGRSPAPTSETAGRSSPLTTTGSARGARRPARSELRRQRRGPAALRPTCVATLRTLPIRLVRRRSHPVHRDPRWLLHGPIRPNGRCRKRSRRRSELRGGLRDPCPARPDAERALQRPTAPRPVMRGCRATRTVDGGSRAGPKPGRRTTLGSTDSGPRGA